ncbi:hypothetical protein M885DRAFT_127209 [Pelagophyceae sp. CCMP2097]|nr:hypothetical protein M885DRAFT_127209 [Pelagophyceae sp. CCMP2097]
MLAAAADASCASTEPAARDPQDVSVLDDAPDQPQTPEQQEGNRRRVAPFPFKLHQILGDLSQRALAWDDATRVLVRPPGDYSEGGRRGPSRASSIACLGRHRPARTGDARDAAVLCDPGRRDPEVVYSAAQLLRVRAGHRQRARVAAFVRQDVACLQGRHGGDVPRETLRLQRHLLQEPPPLCHFDRHDPQPRSPPRATAVKGRRGQAGAEGCRSRPGTRRSNAAGRLRAGGGRRRAGRRAAGV